MGTSSSSKRIGLIAGNGRLPVLFADAAREQGLEVVAVAHEGETTPDLSSRVSAISWVKLGQIDKMVRALRDAGITEAVMAGGIGRVRAFKSIRPDLGALRIVTRLKSFRDDGLLRAIAAYFEDHGIRIVAPTDYLRKVLAPDGVLAGPALHPAQEKDVALGAEAAELLGRVDVGQTVIVKNGHVLAVEAIEGTDETIRRGAKLGGAGVVVVKLAKPGQDERFDLPAVGPSTIAVMGDCGARVLAIEAGKTVVLDADGMLAEANRSGVTVIGIRRGLSSGPTR